MKLGGFVIHGNNRDTLGACLESLRAVCDEVVAVDSCSTDGSADLVDAAGVRRVVQPWQGYGAARARAVSELQDCDYIFFLDSDERLEPEAIEQLRRWKESSPSAGGYALRRRDWVELEDRRFVYRTQWRKRLLRREAARWTPEMIVHEAIHGVDAVRLEAVIEHRFATSLEVRADKNQRYALLWAVQAHAEGKRGKAPSLQRIAHFIKDSLIEGAVIRGGPSALQLCWQISAYHSQKYAFLNRMRRGDFKEQVARYRSGELGELFSSLPTTLSYSSAQSGTAPAA